ncbi:MAG: poly-gamma-glutamate system protein [Treponema sp.]|jgi:poly-gamma-glutamate system protein|nr:poly-gamma-glutamate system protein [Treponema sp.]
MKKPIILCFALIAWTVVVYNYWRFLPADEDCLRAMALYEEMQRNINKPLIGEEYTPMTTTLGSLEAKKSSLDPIAAALIVKLLKEAQVTAGMPVAINGSGSFPGFILAGLCACSALRLNAFVIASAGSSSYGANVKGATIADILLDKAVSAATDSGGAYRLLALTPGGSEDRGAGLDAAELKRLAAVLAQNNIPFFRPRNITEAINFRTALFEENNCGLLINIGGNHAAAGDETQMGLLYGLIKPDDAKKYNGDGLMQRYLFSGKQVIQLLNTKKLYAAYKLRFDKEGALISGDARLLRYRKPGRLFVLAPPACLLLLAALRRKMKRSG